MTVISIPESDDPLHPIFCRITTSKGIYNVPLHEIFFVECHQKKSLLHTRAGTLTLPLPLYQLKEVLPASIFLQTHRSFLVNMKRISHIDKQSDPWTIFFFDTKENAYISRSYRQQVIHAVND